AKVDPRTKAMYMTEREFRSRNLIDTQVEEETSSYINVGVPDNLMELDVNNSNDDKQEQEFNFLVKERSKKHSVGNTRSLHNSNRHIEPELLRIVQNYAFFDELLLHNIGNQQHLSACLPYIAFRETVGSLAAYDNFDLLDYSDFLSMSKNAKEKAGTGSKPFPGTLLKLMKKI
ncbi:16296_t:CDS:2, partial [Rhizophagus irregularis]